MDSRADYILEKIAMQKKGSAYESKADYIMEKQAGLWNLVVKGGKNRFFKPFATSYYDPGVDHLYANSMWSSEPEDGILVLFPSYLLHCADPYEGTQKDRIAIAMNMKINVLKERING